MTDELLRALFFLVALLMFAQGILMLVSPSWHRKLRLIGSGLARAEKPTRRAGRDVRYRLAGLGIAAISAAAVWVAIQVFWGRAPHETESAKAAPPHLEGSWVQFGVGVGMLALGAYALARPEKLLARFIADLPVEQVALRGGKLRLRTRVLGIGFVVLGALILWSFF